MSALRSMEGVETRKEGIFVMPKDRITILATYWYRASQPNATLSLVGGLGGSSGSRSGSAAAALPVEQQVGELKREIESLKTRHARQLAAQAEELQRVRLKCLP